MQRKTDRRTLYTKKAIKDAMLELENETTYEHINVTMICKKAEISRATFYLHYDCLDQVLDEILDDALLYSSASSTTVVDVLDVIRAGRIDLIKSDPTILPACQRIADSDRYHRLFLDPSLSSHIISRLYVHEHDAVVKPLMEKGNLSQDEAEMIFSFILHGSFEVNRSLGWQRDEKWYRYQAVLAMFINNGLSSLQQLQR